MKNNLCATLTVIGRVLIAVIFIYGGVIKIAGYTQFMQLLNAHHISGHLLPLVIALELLGGLALVFGALTRMVAAVLTIYSLVAIWLFLWPPVNQTMAILVAAELGMVGGLVSYVATGAGRFSLDRLWFRKH